MARFVTTLLLMMVWQISNCQVRYGIKTGLNQSVYRLYEQRFEKYKPGFNAGLMLQIPMNKSFIIQAEFLYTEKGYKEGGDYPVTTYLDYISLPVLLGWRASDKIFFLAGPDFSVLLSEDHKLMSAGEYTDSHKKFDMAFNAGLAFQITKSLGIDARYSYGIIHNRKVLYAAGPTGNDIQTKFAGNNRSYQLNIFYLFSK